jgi:hypothetical protein
MEGSITFLKNIEYHEGQLTCITNHLYDGTELKIRLYVLFIFRQREYSQICLLILTCLCIVECS